MWYMHVIIFQIEISCGVDTTVEWLRLNLRFSHGFISVQNIILASLNHTSIGTVSVNGYL